MSKFIEVDIKNKKHTECCDVLSTALDEIDKHQSTLETLRKDATEDTAEQIDNKLNDLRFKKVILKDKAKRCGCREITYKN